MKKTMMALVMIIFSLGFIKPFGAKADTLPIGKCTMTINPNNNYDNRAQTDGPCQGLVTGYYQAEQNQYNTMGLVRFPVNYSGQKFTVYLPQGQYIQAELTVYTTSSQQSGNTTNPSQTIQKKTGWAYSGGKWYFLDNSGTMKTGWVSSGGKWYYLYGSGAMAQDTKIGSYRIGHDGSWMK